MANKLTEAQRRLYDDICNHGGSLVVDGRRGTAAKALRAAGLITAVMRLEADMLRGRLTEQWWCRVTGRAALNQDGGA